MHYIRIYYLSYIIRKLFIKLLVAERAHYEVNEEQRFNDRFRFYGINNML